MAQAASDGKRPWPVRLAWSAGRVVLGVASFLAAVLLFGWWLMIRMPGESQRGPLPALSGEQEALRDELHAFVGKLAAQIGERNIFRPGTLEAAADLIERSLAGRGWSVRRQSYEVRDAECFNLEAEISGTSLPGEIVVVGAHYDSVPGTPGADDNASAVAALLALGRAFSEKRFPRTLRLVAFVNEEPPFFQTEDMGSLVYARECRRRGDNIVAMLALEMLGAYTDAPGSQAYPPPLSWFYPDRGDFVAFVGDLGSRALVRRAIGSFRRHAQFPSEGVAIFGGLPGIGYSDHWSFWQVDVPAIMVTDTAFFRNHRYHQADDTADTLDYGRMARVVSGLERVIEDLLENGP